MSLVYAAHMVYTHNKTLLITYKLHIDTEGTWPKFDIHGSTIIIKP